MLRGKTRHLAWFGVVSLLALGLAACSEDDPTDPGDVDSFDQGAAITQAEQMMPVALEMVEHVSDIAQGVGSKQEGSLAYEWNDDLARWEWTFVASDDTYSWSWLYTVQYIDADGQPQQGVIGVDRVAFTMDSTGSGTYSEEGTSATWEFVVDYDHTISGLGGETYVLEGSGREEIDYTVVSDGATGSAHYVVSYEILEGGIAIPAGGCYPAGTIRYTMAPYRMDVVFDGTSTVNYTVYDGSGTPVHNGSETLECEG